MPGRPGNPIKPRNPWLGRLRIVGLYLFLAVLVLLAEPTPGWFAAGSVLALLGEGVRVWAAGHLVKSKQLITAGPYAFVQHPLYLGRLLILTGLCLVARMDHYWNLWILAGGYGLFFLYYFPRKLRVEGNRLREHHGSSWTRYSESIPNLFPSHRRFSGSGERWSLGKVLRNREYLVLAGLLFLLVLFFVRLRMGT